MDVIPDPAALPPQSMPWARAITKLVQKLTSDSSNASQRTANTLAQLQSTIQALSVNVSNLTAKFTASIASMTFSGNQINSGTVSASYIATIPSTQVSGDWSGNVNSSGFVTANNITANGQVYSASPLRSPGSRNYSVVSGYVGAWINTDGTIGYSASSSEVKKDLVAMTGDNSAFMGLTPYWGRYTWDSETDPLKVFLLAEEVKAAGFGPDVAPVDENGDAFTINYSQLVVPLFAELKRAVAEIDTLKSKVAALESKVG